METRVHLDTPVKREHLVCFIVDGFPTNVTLRDSDLTDMDEVAWAAYCQWMGIDTPAEIDLNVIKPKVPTEE